MRLLAFFSKYVFIIKKIIQTGFVLQIIIKIFKQFVFSKKVFSLHSSLAVHFDGIENNSQTFHITLLQCM